MAPPYRSREITSSLLQKGFKKKEGDHHFYYFYMNGARTPIKTFVSHGAKDYGSELLSPMRKQLLLTKEQLEGLIECPLKEDELKEIYASKLVNLKDKFSNSLNG
ncbi:MAG: hypothetical protein FWH46_03545 [Methanimicrococcus sp.]|nr:hypothetical protein [Methanimicrococcus sp.]MCL2141934.1 hypothetical protein [Methanimicrococcus sp.]